ncbi:aminopeptidase P family protein [Actinotignum sp. GS-2025b]|uniref:aminopeptidase P family protein n=1 Tax=Actinotignum sp. GS-2025b TaxID=3427275 RepID=UPI003F462319
MDGMTTKGQHDQDTAQQNLRARGNNRSQQPSNLEFREFMGSDWGPRPEPAPRTEVADYLPARHAALSALFPGERLVIPAGETKVRANDTDYRFRAHSAFSHMTGLGGEQEPGAVLVFNPREEGGHDVTLYFYPRASRSSEEFYSDPAHGEFWVGARPSLEEVSRATGLATDSLDNLPDALAKDLGEGQVSIRVLAEASEQITAQVSDLRAAAGLSQDSAQDVELAQALSELRFIKDDFEVREMRKAVAATYSGFDEIIRSLPRAVAHHRGERVVEGAFFARAREEGNGLGYDTIAASGNHANTLHWMTNDGEVREGDLILVDAGVELDSLYTADITRTLPVTGTFTEEQAEVYNAVLEAAERALEVAGTPGVKFKDVHAAAMEVIAAYLEKWGMLPGTAAQSLAPEGQYHRRWMPHGTSHHLGLDVHDCAAARRDMYLDAELKPGMVFTIEPGLYFREDDLKVPERFRGIGVRIEDDILITENGAERLSEDIPRTIADIEEWFTRVQR